MHEIDAKLLGGQLWVGTHAHRSPSDGYENGPTREYAVVEIDAPRTHTIDGGNEVSFLVDGEQVASLDCRFGSVDRAGE